MSCSEEGALHHKLGNLGLVSLYCRLRVNLHLCCRLQVDPFCCLKCVQPYVNARRWCFFLIHCNCLKLAQIPLLPVAKKWGNLDCAVQYSCVPSMERWLNFSCSAWLSDLLCKSLCAYVWPRQKCIMCLAYLLLVTQRSLLLSSASSSRLKCKFEVLVIQPSTG